MYRHLNLIHDNVSEKGDWSPRSQFIHYKKGQCALFPTCYSSGLHVPTMLAFAGWHWFCRQWYLHDLSQEFADTAIYWHNTYGSQHASDLVWDALCQHITRKDKFIICVAKERKISRGLKLQKNICPIIKMTKCPLTHSNLQTIMKIYYFDELVVSCWALLSLSFPIALWLCIYEESTWL